MRPVCRCREAVGDGIDVGRSGRAALQVAGQVARRLQLLAQAAGGGACSTALRQASTSTTPCIQPRYSTRNQACARPTESFRAASAATVARASTVACREPRRWVEVDARREELDGHADARPRDPAPRSRQVHPRAVESPPRAVRSRRARRREIREQRDALRDAIRRRLGRPPEQVGGREQIEPREGAVPAAARWRPPGASTVASLRPACRARHATRPHARSGTR